MFFFPFSTQNTQNNKFNRGILKWRIFLSFQHLGSLIFKGFSSIQSVTSLNKLDSSMGVLSTGPLTSTACYAGFYFIYELRGFKKCNYSVCLCLDLSWLLVYCLIIQSYARFWFWVKYQIIVYIFSYIFFGHFLNETLFLYISVQF